MIEFPKHDASMIITHNDHKTVYQTVEQWLCENEDRGEFASAEARQRAIDTDEVWELHWHPSTPVGFLCVFAPIFDELVAFAREVE